MTVKIVGIREANFTPKDGSEAIVGKTLYFLSEDDKTLGYVCDKCFVVPKKFVNGVVPQPNDVCELYYNKFGRVESVEVRQDAKA